MSVMLKRVGTTLLCWFLLASPHDGSAQAAGSTAKLAGSTTVDESRRWRPSKATIATLERIAERSQQKDLLATGQGYWLLKQGANGYYTLTYQVYYYYPDESLPGCKIFYTKGKLMVVHEACTAAQNTLEWRTQLSGLINAQLAQQFGVEVKGEDGRTYTKMSNENVFRGDAYLLANKGGGLQLVDVIKMR